MDLRPGSPGGTDAATRRSAFIAATLAAFLTPFMGSAVNVALPAIGTSLSLDPIGLGWVASSYLLAAAVFLVPAGRAADLLGRKQVFLYGMGLYTISSAVCAATSGSGMLMVGRALQGVGAAMIFGTGMAIVTAVFPADQRGRILGFNVAAVYAGLSFGPFVGGFLIQAAGWRTVFWVNVPLGLFVLVYTRYRLLGEWSVRDGGTFDIGGAAVYGGGLFAVMVGLSRLPSTIGWAFAAAGALLLALFVALELHTPHPMLDIRMIARNRVFALSSLAALIHYSATFAVTFLLSMYLQYVKGMTPAGAGTVLIAQPVLMAVLSPAAGRLSDRFEPRIVSSAGMALTATGLALLAALDVESSMALVIIGLVILGAGFALFSSPNSNAVMSSVDKHLYGTASSFLGTMRLTGQMLSMGIAMLLLAFFVGPRPILPDVFEAFTACLRAAYGLFAVLCLAAIFASLSRGNIRS